MRNPIFSHRWFKGKRPELQIRILKSVVQSGQLSQKRLAEILHAHYSVVSDAVDGLLAKQFATFSGERLTTGRRPEKFYKITEKGLRALLSTDLDPNNFWKTIILLCASSKIQVSQKEFEGYYHKFEHSLFGHVDVPGYFFLAHLFEDILDQWLKKTHSYPDTPVSQIIIECLALNGSITLEKLLELSRAKEEDVIKVLNMYSIQANSKQNSHFDIPLHNAQMSIDIQKFYHDFLSHLLIVSNETVRGKEYSLSLFGVMLAISLIRYSYKGANEPSDPIAPNDNYSSQRLVLFYKNIDQEKYLDTIVKNYSHKVPLIFGKWELLKSELGRIMLYETFDFLIFKNDMSNNMHSSILSLGNKEFYDDMVTLSYNALNKLRLVYGSGTHILRGYEKKKPGIRDESRIVPIYIKVREIGEILSYAELAAILQGLKTGKKIWYYESQNPNMMSYLINDIEKIEHLFSVELCFPFYLNLNTIFFPSSASRGNIKTDQKRIIIDERTKEIFRLGLPKQRLMTILAKDREIKQWFSTWIQDIIDFRIITSNMMSDFYKEINKPQKSIKIPPKIRDDKKAEPEIEFLHEEYDMSEICSDIHSVYDHSKS